MTSDTYKPAIKTSLRGRTPYKAAQILATAPNGQLLFTHYDPALPEEACHKRAAEALRKMMGTEGGELIGGKSKTGMVWVIAP